MCNYCECENSDKCSIVGNIPLGFCCPKCIYYTDDHTCLNSKMRTEKSIQSKIKQIEALRSAFQKGEEEKEKEQELENYP